MDKNVSLEAEEAKKADTAAEPEGETVETPATPENESKDETTPVADPKGGDTEGSPADTDAEKAEDKPADEKPADEKPSDEETTEDKPEAEPEKGEAEGEVKSEESSGEEGEDENGEAEKPAASEGEAEKSDETKPEDKTENKSAEQTAALLKSVQDLTDGMKKILETNEALTKRVQELEKEPATRKTIELEKGIGDEDGEPAKDAKTLKQEMEEQIAQVRKDNYGNPNLFAMVQKIRADYSKKIRG
jgi:hypothetical protein